MVTSAVAYRVSVFVTRLQSTLSVWILDGWVRNVVDGRVEVLFEGDEAAVAELASWLEQGPEAADVTHLELQDHALQGIAGFIVRR